MTALRSRRRHGYIALGLATVAALTLAGCAEGGDEGDADDGSLEGETVQISGGITGSEADNLQKSFDAFTADTGIEVVYTGDKGFEGNIVTKVAGGSAPDIAIVPQPGLFRSLVETGEVISQLAAFAPHSVLGMNFAVELHRMGEDGETHVLMRRIPDD